MADTIRTLSALQAMLPDNTTHDISPQDVRDFLVSVYNWVNTVGGDISYSGGDVGIGTTVPLTPLNVTGTTMLGASVAAVNYYPTVGDCQLFITSATNGAINTGALLSFAGKRGTAAAQYSFGGIGGFKENATADDLDGYLGFFTLQDGAGTCDERMRITSTGSVGIGTSAPTSKLQVVGLPQYANNAAAVTGGLSAGAFYRTGGDPDLVCVVH